MISTLHLVVFENLASITRKLYQQKKGELKWNWIHVVELAFSALVVSVLIAHDQYHGPTHPIIDGYLDFWMMCVNFCVEIIINNPLRLVGAPTIELWRFQDGTLEHAIVQLDAVEHARHVYNVFGSLYNFILDFSDAFVVPNWSRIVAAATFLIAVFLYRFLTTDPSEDPNEFYNKLARHVFFGFLVRKAVGLPFIGQLIVRVLEAAVYAIACVLFYPYYFGNVLGVSVNKVLGRAAAAVAR